MEEKKQRRDRRKEKGGRKNKKLAYSRSCSGLSNPQSEAAPLCSWMVCSSSDSEGRSLKVLSSRPGASREKRRTRWGRGVAASGSAVLAGVQGWWGPSAPVESVTAGFCEMQPLFWFASGSPRPAHKTTGVMHGLGPAWHTTSHSSTMGAFERRAPSAAAGDTGGARSSEGEATLLASEKIEQLSRCCRGRISNLYLTREGWCKASSNWVHRGGTLVAQKQLSAAQKTSDSLTAA